MTVCWPFRRLKGIGKVVPPAAPRRLPSENSPAAMLGAAAEHRPVISNLPTLHEAA